MTLFCLNEARNTSPCRVLKILTEEAVSFADYYAHEAVCCNDPDESEFIRQKADDARDLAVSLRNSPAFDKVLAMVAYSIAEFAVDVGDRELFDEMAGLADSFAVRVQ
jgi:hypothetical protein